MENKRKATNHFTNPFCILEYMCPSTLIVESHRTSWLNFTTGMQFIKWSAKWITKSRESHLEVKLL